MRACASNFYGFLTHQNHVWSARSVASSSWVYKYLIKSVEGGGGASRSAWAVTFPEGEEAALVEEAWERQNGDVFAAAFRGRTRLQGSVCFRPPGVPEGRRQDKANASLETIPGRL